MGRVAVEDGAEATAVVPFSAVPSLTVDAEDAEDALPPPPAAAGGVE